MLALHQDIQEKVVQELHEVFDNQDGVVTFDDISKLTYLEMVIKESPSLSGWTIYCTKNIRRFPIQRWCKYQKIQSFY